MCLWRQLFLECLEDGISSETSTAGYLLTRRLISEDWNTHGHRFENLRSPKSAVHSCEKGVCDRLVHSGRLLLGLFVHENWLPFYEMGVCVCV
jgi:hypothetical protein